MYSLLTSYVNGGYCQPLVLEQPVILSMQSMLILISSYSRLLQLDRRDVHTV